MSRVDNLRVLRKAVNKTHGAGTMDLAINVAPLDIPRLSTGSLAFDFALGGGIPVGRVTLFWGSESSGKTTAAYRIGGIAQGLCANCLRRVSDLEVVEIVDKATGEVEYLAEATCDCYSAGLIEPKPRPSEKTQTGTLRQVEIKVKDEKTGKEKTKKVSAFSERLKVYEENSYEEFRIALIDVEGAWDLSWGKKVGLDERRMIYVRPQTAEEAIDIYESLMLTGAVDYLIMDSIAQLTPSAEIKASTMDWQQGLQARLVNKWNRISTAALTIVARDYGHTPTQVWINQERTDISKKMGSKKMKPGGNAQKFTASVDAYMWASGWQKAQRDTDLKEGFHMEMGKEVAMNFNIMKNKTAPAKVTGSYIMSVVGRSAGEIIDLPYVLAQADKYGLVRKESATKWWLGEEVFKTKGAMLAKMEQPDVLFALKDALLKKMIQTREEM